MGGDRAQGPSQEDFCVYQERYHLRGEPSSPLDGSLEDGGYESVGFPPVLLTQALWSLMIAYATASHGKRALPTEGQSMDFVLVMGGEDEATACAFELIKRNASVAVRFSDGDGV